MNHQYDLLVIGSGIAGLNFALSAAKYGQVAVITKKELMESNSNYAQGGIAAVLDEHDSFQRHIKDTLEAGCYLNDKEAVEMMVKEAPQAIQHLIDLGTGFNRQNNQLSLTQEGGHSARRIAHAKDATGKEIERALFYEVNRQKEERKLEYDVCYEATHHGPALTKPTLFIEIGNDEAHWADKSAAEVIAETIMNSTKPSGKRIALNIGGQHYPHYTTKLALATDIAFSHMCPEWAIKEFTGQSLQEMISKTPEKIDLIAVEWKGLGKEKERIMKILESQSLPFEKADRIK